MINKLFYFLIILDDGWLRFLMGNSLMLEGLVSFLFATFVINISKAKLQKASVAENSFFILFLSLLIFSKQFIETIVLIVLLYIFLVIRDKVSTLPFLVIIFINQIYNRIYFNSLIDIEYIDIKDEGQSIPKTSRDFLCSGAIGPLIQDSWQITAPRHVHVMLN